LGTLIAAQEKMKSWPAINPKWTIYISAFEGRNVNLDLPTVSGISHL
jgi:hypothetical protein